MKKLISFFKDEEGATAIEYGLLAGLISVLIIAGATLIGTHLQAIFNFIAGKLGAVPIV